VAKEPTEAIYAFIEDLVFLGEEGVLMVKD
jgi:hypothetical protein